MATNEQIEKEALTRLRNKVKDFHLVLKALADYSEKEPFKFKLALSMLKSKKYEVKEK